MKFGRFLGAMIALLICWPAAAFQTEPVHILVYGDSNSWGWIANRNAFPAERLAYGRRWPDVMANSLGSRFLVSVDALSGRTVNVDYPENIGTLPGADFNGARFLPSAVARELPLGLVIIMLGTNDARSDLDRSPHQIADGIFQLTELVKGSTGGVMTNYPAPRVLVVVPPHIEDTSNTPIGGVMEGAREKSQQLAEAVRIALINSNTPVFDASTVVRIGGIDGIHMTEIDHQRLGEALAVEVSTLMAN